MLLRGRLRVLPGLLLEAVQHARQRAVVLDRVERWLGRVADVRGQGGLRPNQHGGLWPGRVQEMRLQLLIGDYHGLGGFSRLLPQLLLDSRDQPM